MLGDRPGGTGSSTLTPSLGPVATLSEEQWSPMFHPIPEVSGGRARPCLARARPAVEGPRSTEENMATRADSSPASELSWRSRACARGSPETRPAQPGPGESGPTEFPRASATAVTAEPAPRMQVGGSRTSSGREGPFFKHTPNARHAGGLADRTGLWDTCLPQHPRAQNLPHPRRGPPWL